MKRVGYALLIGLLLLTPTASHAFSDEYISRGLSATVYSDGIVAITYDIDVDPTQVRLEVPLFGSSFADLLVVNELGVPLVTAQSGKNVTIDTLGSSTLTIIYSTPEFTSKIGMLWTLNLTSPTNLVVTMPSGSTIVSLSQIPLNVKTLAERTQITLPPGLNEVSYIVSATAVKDHAESVIQDAEAAIETVKDKGVITSEADFLLDQAKTSFNAGEYLNSEQLASKAKNSALTTETVAQAAASAIKTAATAVQNARNEARTSNLAEAEALLADAQSKYSSGFYSEAKTNADASYSSATASKPETNYTFIILGGTITFILVAGGLFLYNKRRIRESTKTAPVPRVAIRKADDGVVNLESIFKKHPDLRVDDREVLRFIADHRGEAFANEIRNRFDIPRTSAWRMIRRLISMGILEEKKIGGQSLIYIVKKYREAQD